MDACDIDDLPELLSTDEIELIKVYKKLDYLVKEGLDAMVERGLSPGSDFLN